MKNDLTTAYAENMNKSCPWQDYPRPAFKRDSYISLNGEWDFCITRNDIPEYNEKILVPFPPESPLSGIERTHENGEYLYYRRYFCLPDGFVHDRVILHFDAVDQISTVYLNGQEIAYNEGGYIPFQIDITDTLQIGENELSLKVRDDLDLTYPYGKQRRDRGGMWYTPVSGIWQSVWLESLPEEYIEAIKITPDASKVKIEVKTKIKNKRITIAETGEVIEFDGEAITFSPHKIINWTPDDPYLYHFTLEAGSDKVESYFALREVDIKNVGGTPVICLNGKPMLMNGLLDQGYFPDGIFLPATKAGYEEDIKTAKSLGFNMLRKHIKIEPQIFYYLCDKMGIIVFQDFVNNSDYSFLRDTALPTIGIKRICDKRLHKDERSREIFIDTMHKTQTLLYNHPSVVCYTVFNEGWGQFMADDVYANAKKNDPTRLYDATSGWFWRKDSDFYSHHVYFKKLKVKSSSKRPTIISEFGGYSHRVQGHVFGEDNYGYRNFAVREEFEDAVAKLYLEEVLPIVQKGVCALVYTQISDVEDETNGFLTYDRRVLKVDKDRFYTIAQKLYSAFSKGIGDIL